ncbi:MAG: CotH kinase family protein [Saprospiraceae bacterium]
MRISSLLVILWLAAGGVWSQTADLKPAEDPIELVFNQEGGFYDHPLDIYLSAPKGVIFYTLDGSKPGRRSYPYRRSITIEETTVLRVVVYNEEGRSAYFGQTYFINEPPTRFPVISLAVTSSMLFDPIRGVFMQGNQVIDSLWQKPGANFWTRREFPIHTEIYEVDGNCVYNNATGFRLFGGMSRLFPQKSLALVARNRYGQSRIDYPIFGKEGPKKFKFLVLRNAGSDFGKSHFRDALMTGLVDDWDIEKQLYRPSHVYINGKYWGIYNIREKVNRYFVEAHSEANKDSIDLIEHRMIKKRGSLSHYQEMLRFLERYDLSITQNFEHLQSMMEVDNFMKLQIAQIYFDNQDAGGNIKFWRPQTPDGRWRWILFDTDWGYGLHDHHAYQNNSLAFHTEPEGPHWPNPPWSTFILRKLLENPGFQRDFVNHFADYLNTSFSSAQADKRIDDLYKQIAPEIDRHLNRWHLSKTKWEEQIEIIRTFARERPHHVRMHLMEHFRTGALRQLDAIASEGGRIVLNNNITISGTPFSGQYFANYPIQVKAIADYGYRFSHWEGISMGEGQREFELKLSEERYSLKAVFVPFIHPLVGQVMINEISPNNKQSGDWIEIFNRSKDRVSLRGWTLADKKNTFVFPDISLAPNDYLVVCEDEQKFLQAFPQAYNVIGRLGFGLNKREECLQLFSELGAAVDSIAYEIPPRDSAFTLSLLLPSLDNNDIENWEIRSGLGSPNLPNPYYVESSIRYLQSQWMQVGLAAGVVILCIILLILRQRKLL